MVLETKKTVSRSRFSSGRSKVGFLSQRLTSILPTLEESTSEDEAAESKEVLCSSFDGTEVSTDISSYGGASDVSVLVNRVSCQLDRNKELALKAFDLAARGGEEDAIKLYKMITNQNRSEIGKFRAEMASGCSENSTRLESAFWALGEAHANICTTLAILYDRVGDLDLALKFAKEAMEIYEDHKSKPGLSPSSKGWLEERSATLNIMSSRIKNAKRTKICRDRARADLKTLWNKFSSVEGSTEREEILVRISEETRTLLQQELHTVGQYHPLVADLLMSLGRTLVAAGEFREATLLMQKGLSISKVALGPSHPQTAKKVIDLAKAYECQNMPKQAIDHYEEAIKILQKSCGSHKTLVLVLLDRASLFTSKAMISDAIQDYTCALNLMKETPQLRRQRLACMKDLIYCYIMRQSYDEAVELSFALLKAQKFDREGSLRQSRNDRFGTEVAEEKNIFDTLVRMSRAYLGTGNHKQARECLDRACSFYKQTKTKDFEVVDNAALLLAYTEVDAALGCAESSQFRLVLRKFDSMSDSLGQVRCLLGEFSVLFIEGQEERAYSLFAELFLSAKSSDDIAKLLHIIDTHLVGLLDFCQYGLNEKDPLIKIFHLRREGKYDLALAEVKNLLQLQKEEFLALPKMDERRQHVLIKIGLSLKAAGDIYLILGNNDHAGKSYMKSIEITEDCGFPQMITREMEDRIRVFDLMVEKRNQKHTQRQSLGRCNAGIVPSVTTL